MGHAGSAVTRLYRFYNYLAGRHGEPFALCDACVKAQPVPDGPVLQCIADEARSGCVGTFHRERRRTKPAARAGSR